MHNDEDAAQYAEQFASLFRDAGWNVWGVDRPYTLPFGGNNIGLTLLATQKAVVAYQGAQNFAEALNAVNITCHYYVTYELVPESCELIVGHRGEATY